MNELMIHVERIVRPVSAMQRRKLRMRQELLAHLQATLDEERERFPNDEQAATEQAKLRLGEPTELTRNLQRTVPTVERLLLSRLPMSRSLDQLEKRMARVPGKVGAMTLGHISILTGAASVLAAAPILLSTCYILKTSSVPPHGPIFLLATLIGLQAILFLSYRLVFSTADSDARLDLRSTFVHSGLILVLQTALASSLNSGNRVATLASVTITVFATIVFLAIVIFIAHRISVLRRRYDEWLALEIA